MFILLDNSRDADGASYLFEAPREMLRADTPEEAPGIIARLDAAIQDGAYAAGFFSYELGYALEPRLARLMPQQRRVPLIWFGVFERRCVLTPVEVTEFLHEQAALGPNSANEVQGVQPEWSEQDYAARFDRVKNYLRNGDIYQLNLTFKTHFEYQGNPAALYLKLRGQQPVSYSAFIDAPEFKALSLSPELFIAQRGKVMETRPMKGTAARAFTPRDDASVAAALAQDKKAQAENLMIVDLMRNDLGRLAEKGSVQVSGMFHVDTYKTLHQMISTVSARLRETTTLPEVLRALFPPGSVTGTPKIRAQEIIRDLEDGARGLYTGAIGMLGPRGEKALNVAIRTAMLFPKSDGSYAGELGIGSGVVQDSVMRAEYEECLLKARFFTAPQEAFGLIETLRHDAGKGYYLLERHMARLAASAQYFAISFDKNAARLALQKEVEGKTEPHLRVRLQLNPDGSMAVTSAALPPKALRQVIRFAIAPDVINSTTVHLYHKTTARAFLDVPCKVIKEQTGCDEVVFLNERGEVTQGSYTNIFIDDGAGVLLTPPVACGLLPGTLRAELMDIGKVVEKTLYPEDMARARHTYLGNSLRGLLRAERI